MPVIGQRWLSDAETELGLGMITTVENRRAEIDFPATGVRRIYALDSAPLSRVRFLPGEMIASRTQPDLQVIEVIEDSQLLRYRCLDMQDAEVNVDEEDLDDHLQLNRPREKLLAARLDTDTWFSLRYRGWHRQASEYRSPVYGLRGARISLLPHQLYIASEVATRHAPRVLLADEVGLGKTIEAGLILHKLLLDGKIRRVLLLVPDALLNQWLVEMRRRFNLNFSLFDRERMEQIEADNPFHQAQLVLTSTAQLLSSPGIARNALEGDWDLLLVDEAHHLHWTPDESSVEYELVDALAAQTPAVLLLTATPEQLGPEGHFARLRLLDPARFSEYPEFMAQQRDFSSVARLADSLLANRQLDDSEQQLLEQLLGGDVHSDPRQNIRALIDRHGTGRVMFRNRRKGISGFPGRALHATKLDMPAAYSAQQGDLTQRLTPEKLYGPDWVEIDPRVSWLLDLLESLHGEKVVLICAHADTVIQLRDYLLRKHALHAAMFHEQMQIIERDRAAAFFADAEAGSQLLLCSEIGSEGRNFQTAHHLVLFDLPLRPGLLEQRIGRLDRIGQRHDVQIHVPVFSASVNDLLFQLYHHAINAFEQTSQAGAAVFVQIEPELPAIMDRPGDWPAFIEQTASLHATLDREVEAGRDRLLELHSNDTGRAGELIETIDSASEQAWVENFLQDYWDAFGVEVAQGPGRSMVLHPGAHMLSERFPGLPDAGATVTFAREDALAHEDREFLSFEHPMTRGALDHLLYSDLGSTAMTVIAHDSLPTGTLLLELIFVLDCPAPPELNLQAYLPASDIRLVLDKNGVDQANGFAHDKLQGVCLRKRKKVVQVVLKSLLKLADRLLERGELLANRQAEDLVATARDLVNRQLGTEQRRLQALAAVNPAVREDELEYFTLLPELMNGYLDRAVVHLDAIRVIVVG